MNEFNVIFNLLFLSILFIVLESYLFAFDGDRLQIP